MSTRRIDSIIIHCSATPNGRYHTAEDINRWHLARGWNSIGYHWVIRTDGVTEQGRDEAIPGAHVAGHNSNSIGVCMIGTDEFSPEQWASLEGIVSLLKHKYPNADVLGHNDFTNAKTCPGFNVLEWYSDVRNKLKE